LKATPAVALDGALTEKWVAAAGLTVIEPLDPVTADEAVSVAVSRWLPAVRRVALKVAVPLVRVLLAGGRFSCRPAPGGGILRELQPAWGGPT
jgi:hypothetical protein